MKYKCQWASLVIHSITIIKTISFLLINIFYYQLYKHYKLNKYFLWHTSLKYNKWKLFINNLNAITLKKNFIIGFGSYFTSNC